MTKNPKYFIAVLLGLASAHAGFSQALFTDATSTATGLPRHWLIAMGDFDNNGVDDLVVGAEDGSVQIWKRQSAGLNYSNATSGSGLQGLEAVSCGDFNNDGSLDFIHINGNRTEAAIYLNSGNGTFTKAAIPQNESATLFGFQDYVRAVDIDGDGDLDLVFGKPAGSGGSIMAVLNQTRNGASSNQPFSGVTTLAVTNWIHNKAEVTDANGDGKPDLLSIRTAGDWPSGTHPDFPVTLFLNTGTSPADYLNANATKTIAGFTQRDNCGISAANVMSPLASWDIDNDGDLDLINGSSDWPWVSRPHIYVNDGSGIYTQSNSPVYQSTNYYHHWISLFDADLDNDMDAVWTGLHNFSNIYPRMWRNDGNLAFTDVTSAWGINISIGSGNLFLGGHHADLDGDGDIDFIVDMGGGAKRIYRVYRNVAVEQGAKWLGIKLVSSSSAPNGIGARVEVTANGRKLTQYMADTTGGVRNLSSLRFGLGSSNTGASVKVYWPSGQVSEFSNVNENQVLTIIESSNSNLSTNADLSTLTLSSGTLSPTFASAATAYAVSVSNATTSINVTPTRSEANATIAARVNGGSYAAVSSGTASASLPLVVGGNSVDVRVTTQDGVTQKIYTVTVTRMAAPTVNTVMATLLTATGASLGGNVTADGGATITERGVVYAATAANADPAIGGTGVTKITATGTTEVFTAPVTGLTQGSGYSYKAYATNSQGTSYSTVVTFTTLSTMTTPTATSITATGATLGGTVVSLAGGRAVERGIVYSEVAANADPQLEGLGVSKLPRSGSIGTFTVAASGLSPAKTYAYRAYLTTSIETSYSGVGYFTTDTPVAFTSGIGTVSNRVIRGGESQLFLFDLAQSSAAAFSTTGASPAMQWELRDALNALVASGTGNIDFSNALALGGYKLRITNPGVSTETFSLNLDASTPVSPRPDISVGLDPTASSGADLYDPPAPQQSVLAVSTKAAIKNVFFRIDNDGPLPDAMRINGPGHDSRFRVLYVLSGRNVTAAVIAGTATTSVLAAADAPVPLFVRISPNRKNPDILRKVVVTQRPTWVYGRETFGPNGLTVRATTDPTLSDTATFQLNTVP